MMVRWLVVAITVAVAACAAADSKVRHFTAGEELLAANRPAEAVVEFLNAVQLDDRWGEARLKLSAAYAASGQSELAYRESLRAADLLPDNVDAQLKAVSFLLLAAQFEDAKARATRLIAAQPENAEAHTALGNARAGLHDIDGAVASLTEAMRLDPTRSQPHTSLGLIRDGQGDAVAAKAAFEKAVAIDPKSVPAWLALANFQWARGDLPAVEQSLTRVLALEPQSEITNRAIATFYLETSRPAQAEPYLKVLSDAATTPDAKLALADYYAAHERRDAARALVEPLVRDGRVGFAAEARLAELTYAEGRHEAANRALDDLLSRQPNLALGQVLKAQWLLADGKPEEALARTKGALAANPRWSVAQYTRGVAEARTRRYPEAIKTFSELLRQNPRAVDAQLQLSALHLSLGDTVSARQLAEDAVRNSPSNADASIGLVRVLLATGDLARAKSELARLKTLTPNPALMDELTGTLQAASGQAVAARRSFERALAAAPDNYGALNGLARLAISGREPAAAWPPIEHWLARDSNNPAVLLLGARVKLAMRDFAGAEALLTRAIAVDPTDTANFSALARLYVEQKQLDAALVKFDALAQREPGNISAPAMAAVIAHAQGNLADATSRYEAVLKADSRITVALNNLASIYADLGENLEVAQQLAETAVAQLPGDPDIIDTLGMVHYRRAQFGRAVTQFLRALEIAPSAADYHYHLGLAYMKTGDVTLAASALRSALRLRPQFPDAAKALAEATTPRRAEGSLKAR